MPFAWTQVSGSEGAPPGGQPCPCVLDTSPGLAGRPPLPLHHQHRFPARLPAGLRRCREKTRGERWRDSRFVMNFDKYSFDKHCAVAPHEPRVSVLAANTAALLRRAPHPRKYLEAYANYRYKSLAPASTAGRLCGAVDVPELSGDPAEATLQRKAESCSGSPPPAAPRPARPPSVGGALRPGRLLRPGLGDTVSSGPCSSRVCARRATRKGPVNSSKKFHGLNAGAGRRRGSQDGPMQEKAHQGEAPDPGGPGRRECGPEREPFKAQRASELDDLQGTL